MRAPARAGGPGPPAPSADDQEGLPGDPALLDRPVGVGGPVERGALADHRAQPPAGGLVDRGAAAFVEVVAEDVHPDALPASLTRLRAHGVPVLPHAVSLSLGGAEDLATDRVDHLAAVATALDAPLVSDHVCFVRAGGLESGHLLPVPRTRDALAVLVENVRAAQARLPVPLAAGSS